jgi:hypothetical protein
MLPFLRLGNVYRQSSAINDRAEETTLLDTLLTKRTDIIKDFMKAAGATDEDNCFSAVELVYTLRHERDLI